VLENDGRPFHDCYYIDTSDHPTLAAYLFISLPDSGRCPRAPSLIHYILALSLIGHLSFVYTLGHMLCRDMSDPSLITKIDGYDMFSTLEFESKTCIYER